MFFLNSEQALKDLAYFLGEMSKNNMYKINNNPWIAIGGSYPGALSAWFRYKYPHLTIGAIASSAVILAI
jgi:N-acetyl-gamma-glutamylphosphate reductase